MLVNKPPQMIDALGLAENHHPVPLILVTAIRGFLGGLSRTRLGQLAFAAANADGSGDLCALFYLDISRPHRIWDWIPASGLTGSLSRNIAASLASSFKLSALVRSHCVRSGRDHPSKIRARFA